jgi:hypothetical protein
VRTGGLSGRVFFDTDNHALTGQIVKRLPNPTVDRLTVTLPSGFKAQDRIARWPGDVTVICVPFFGCFPGPPAPVTRSGTITCPPGTSFDVRLVPLTTVDVDSFVC